MAQSSPLDPPTFNLSEEMEIKKSPATADKLRNLFPSFTQCINLCVTDKPRYTTYLLSPCFCVCVCRF